MLDDPPPSRPLLIGPFAGVTLFVLGLVALFTVGRPMGWPLGWWFNAIFILMGAIFLALGVGASFRLVTQEQREHGAEPPSSHMVFTGGGLSFLITGLAISGLAVFMGSLFGSGSSPSRPYRWTGKPSPADVCQQAPFRACLSGGRFMGRFEGSYLAAVEPDGRVSDVRIQAKLPPAVKKCIMARVRSLHVRGGGDHRTAVRCQFVGTAMPSLFKLDLSAGYRRLGPDEPLLPHGKGQPAGSPPTTRAPAPHPRTGPVTDPNVRVTWSEVLATPRCTFFSGPGSLGRDDTLGTVALLTAGPRRATLLLGEGIAFSGRRKGHSIKLVRMSDHYQGRFRVTETITLEPRGKGRWDGRYGYAECDREGKQGCPGRCHIQARLSMEPIRDDQRTR